MPKQQRNLFDTDPPPWELDARGDSLLASVVFPEPPHGPWDYLVPEAMRGRVGPGQRVRVPLGRGNRRLTGYCVGLAQSAVDLRRFKPLDAVLDEQPLVSTVMLQTAQWMAEYYLCPLGQVLQTILPAGVRRGAGARQHVFYSIPTGIAARLTQLKLPPKQAAVMQVLALASQPLMAGPLVAEAGCTTAPLRALVGKGLVHEQRRSLPEPAMGPVTEKAEPVVQLNSDQQLALDAILASLRSADPRTFLMHGVTGSGKTEVYIRSIQEVIAYGRQALVLVPEISLTPQTRTRFRARLQRVAVLHSHLSDAERHGHWRRIAEGQVDVIVGARSAIFAPTRHLGLIVLDEEHDASFKQDQAPRYHARDVALQRARLEQVPLVLGSATPSLESWHRASSGAYRLIRLPRRVMGLPLPNVATIDLRFDARRGMRRGAISRPLQQAIELALSEGGQVILLLNRRGFATSIRCPACGHVSKCPHCDIALTHHRESQRALCHYCDHQCPPPAVCPECGFDAIRLAGVGTERLEAEVRRRFPQAGCLRMDSDTMRRRGSHEKALQQFRSGQIDILLGTQMIAKGLDFPNVTLVGVINADTALHLPDFRAAERTFQLVTQVAGRTGRGIQGGRVLAQTSCPEHPAIQAAVRQDYERFAKHELPLRQQFGYPPSCSLIRLIARSGVASRAEGFLDAVCQALRHRVAQSEQPIRILGPAPAPFPRLRGKHRFHALLMGPDAHELGRLVREATAEPSIPDDMQWVADVDPMDLM